MANKVYASPGVYTSEKDLTYTVETIGVTTLGAAGETLKGPAFQPIPIKNYEEFTTTFGGLSPERFKNTQIVKYELPYIAKAYLSQSNQLYVTRVLGLSGYDKGDAFAMRTIGAIDQTTLSSTVTNKTGSQRLHFTGTTTGTTFNVSGSTTLLIDQIATSTGVDKTKFATVFNTYFSKFTTATGSTNNWYNHDVFRWGYVPTATAASILSLAKTTGGNNSVKTNNSPLVVDAYQLPSTVPTEDETNYYINNEFVYIPNVTGDTYSGLAFTFTTNGVAYNNSTKKVSGHIELYVVSWAAQPMDEYHNKLAATVRSKGLYVSDELEFLASGVTVGYSSTAAIEDSPYGDVAITGKTITGAKFSYNVSLDPNKTNYIEKVLGYTNNDKATNLYVENVYTATIQKGWLNGYIKGLNPTLKYVPAGAGGWNHFKLQFQAPATPYFVSELKGGATQKLFRLISISDGDNANTEVKISIANVDLSKGTFDVLVRDFLDTDKTPVVIERFLNCTMDEAKSNFIGRLIGTIDNKYKLNSSYVIVELDENAPTDAVPAGFEGYNFRTFSGVGVPEIPYKTKYYQPGDVWQNPPFGIPVISSGDKVRKAYLGFSDLDYGFDQDITMFIGKQNNGSIVYNTGNDWGTKTKGFHLDVNAADLEDTSGNILYAVGDGQFTDATLLTTDSTQTYFDIRSRKFTALMSGGFDAWDFYRETRTNGDSYRIGQSGFINGGFQSFASVEYGERFGSSDYYAYLYAYKTFQNPEKVSINVFVTPGVDIINNNELVQEVIEIIEEKRLDSIYLPTLPDLNVFNNNNSANTDDWFFPSDISDQVDNANIDSNYTAIYYPWIQIADTENNAYLFIPPTAEVVRNLAYTDNVAFPWFATAGYNRGVVNCKKARIAVSQDDRDLLYPARINPIATFSDIGNVIWGNRNMQVRSSALDRLNVRRLLLQARKLIISVANRLLFDPNDTTVRSQFLSLVNPILDNIRKERGLLDFRVKLDPVPTDTDRNTLTGKIFLKPIATLEFIELEFDVTPTSVSFDNI